MTNGKPIIIGVTGGSGSGKTSVSRAIFNHFPNHSIMMLEQDSYYKDQSNLSFEERLNTNYDHPFAFDTDLLIEHLQKLLAYETIEKPVYDYVAHTRSEATIIQEPKEVIILEGILILEDERLRDLMDIKLYVDTDERGRTLDSVIEQYLTVVKPMYHQFIEPTKRYADVIVPEGGENHVAIDLITTKVATFLTES